MKVTFRTFKCIKRCLSMRKNVYALSLYVDVSSTCIPFFIYMDIFVIRKAYICIYKYIDI